MLLRLQGNKGWVMNMISNTRTKCKSNKNEYRKMVEQAGPNLLAEGVQELYFGFADVFREFLRSCEKENILLKCGNYDEETRKNIISANNTKCKMLEDLIILFERQVISNEPCRNCKFKKSDWTDEHRFEVIKGRRGRPKGSCKRKCNDDGENEQVCNSEKEGYY